jgi:hypothetical protein
MPNPAVLAKEVTHSGLVFGRQAGKVSNTERAKNHAGSRRG